MRKIRSVLDLSKKAHATFWAACTVAFWAILRVGDYTGWRALGNGVWEPQLMVKDLRSFGHFSDVAVKDPKNGGPSYRSAMAKRTDDLCSSGAVEVMLALDRKPRPESAPLFETAPGVPMSAAWFEDMLKRVCRVALPEVPQEANFANYRTPYLSLRSHGGWLSDAAMQYYDRQQLQVKLLPTMLAAAHGGALSEGARSFFDGVAPPNWDLALA